MIADALQVAREVFARGIPAPRILGEQALDDPAHRGRRLRRELADRLGLFLDDCHERFGAALSLEGAFSRGHLVEDRAERELVGTVVDGLSARLLGRHLTGRAHDGAPLRRGGDRGGKDGRVLRGGLGRLARPKSRITT
jgi:hypothetical protein